MTETILTDDDVAALEALESGGSLTDDQVGRLQTLENTPFFADSIKQGESKGQRFTGAGFAADGSYVSADPASPMVQAQQDPVPPVQGPMRGKDEPAPPEDGMEFNLVTPPPMYVEERETNIRGPRLGAMGPAMESGEFYADDEELLDALRSAPAQGRVLTADEHRTMLELEEKESDKLGALKSGAGMMAAGLWEMAKGIAVEQGITVPGAIGQALSSAVFDPANAASILKQGMVTATNRAVQGELTKVEGMRKGYIGMRQIWSWFNGFIENDQIATDQRQAVMADLRQAGAFGADNVANAQLVEQETAKRREQGLAPFAPTDRTQEFETKYQRYLENEKLNRAYTGQNQYLMGEQVVNERPGIVADQLVTGFNPVTGQPVEPLPYTSMGYGMMFQPDTYVGFGAGYLSKARVVSRAASAARPLFSIAENTAIKAAEVAKTGRDAHKIFTMSNIASGGALATGLGMQFNQSTGDLGKALMFFGAIKPTMRAAGFVFKKVPGGSKVMEAAGVFRPQALRIIAEESKAGPLGAGATAQTPATQAAAIRAARPEAAQRLVNRGSVPDRYARFMGTSTTRAGDVKLSAPGTRGFDSTLKRVAQNPENPPNVRRAARAADEIGLTQAFRTTDDAISGALAGLVGSSPFAAIAPDDQTAGGILAVGTAFGAAGGIAGGATSFKGDAVDADIARFMVDTEAYGGDPQALFQIPRRDLAAMAALQSMSVNKGVDFVALRTEDYWLNVPEAKGAQGYFAAGTAKDGSTPGRMRLFVDLGHSVVQEGGIAKVVKASDGMYELTVVRPDGKVMYPAPASDGSQPVIRRKSPNDFTVKDGDPVSPYSPLNKQSPRIVASAHEFMHALMNSDMFGGDHQAALRGLVYEQYKPESINAMAREYAQRLVDAQINNGAVPKPTNEEAKAKMIDDMMVEMADDSVSKFGDQRAWIADEILSETWQDIAQTTDINRMRQGKSADGRVTDAARSLMIATTRALETFGMKFDWATGKPLTNPSTIFRDNPLANNPLIRKRMLEAVRNYDRYLTLLEDAGAVESKGSPLPRSGNASDWAAEGTMRTHDVGGGIKENDVMIVDPDGQVRWKMQDQIDREYQGRQTGVKDLLKRLGTRKVGENDPTFGLRDAGPLRTIYSGAELPMENSALGYPPVLASFPKWYREMYMDTILPAQRAFESVRFSNNTVGTRSDKGGPYKLKQLISSGFAKQSEGVPFGVQITKSGNHINIEMIDLNAFKAATLKAINDGKISFFNNDYKQVIAGLKQLMDNYRNKRDGAYMIGEEGKNILNGLLYGKSRANQGYGAALNPRGSIRTYRMDRMNWMERTGDNGYFFDNDRAKNNRMPETEPVDGPNNNRMPSALPQAGMAMPDVADAPPFFLKSSQALDAKVQGKSATPDQVKAILTNPQNGIKAEELKWTGVMQEVERLAKENNGKVPKDALLRYLAEDGAVRLEEVELGAARKKESLNEISTRLFGIPISETTQAQGRAVEAERMAAGDRRVADATKYGNYQLPGGKNYREVVLAMPPIGGGQVVPHPEGRGFAIQYKDGSYEGGNTPTRWDSRGAAETTGMSFYKNAGGYTSSHFPDTPNYVAHMRLNERVDAKGKQGLFIEELQSDRHQQGREKGYKEDSNAERDALQAKYNEAVAKREAARNALAASTDTGSILDATDRDLRRAFDSSHQNWEVALGELRRSEAGSIPDAPFRTSWPLQLFKRALRDAVADGKDWIGWTTGETQAARYDLSKQISKVLLVDTDGGNQFLYAYGLDGNEVIRRDVRGENIADIIGKEAAEKLANAPKKKQPNGASERALQGVDLKVGGEGMKGFYDTMVPKEVAKYVKQWGGQVEKSKIKTPGSKKRVDDMSDAELVAELERGEDAVIWRVNITPQMREGIKKAGQALFAAGTAAVVADQEQE